MKQQSRELKLKGLIRISFIEGKDGQGSLWLLPAVFAFLICFILDTVFIEGVRIRPDIVSGSRVVIALMPFVAGALIILANVYLLKKISRKIILLFAGAAICILVPVLFRKVIKSGLLTYINCILVNRNYQSGEIARFLDPETSHSGLALAVFLAAAALIVTEIICLLLYFRIYIAVMISAVISLVAAAFACGKMPVICAGLTISAICLCVIVTDSKKDVSAGLIAAIVGFAALGIIMAITGAVSSVFPANGLSAAKGRMMARLEKTAFGMPDLTDGEFSSIGSRKVNDEVLLQLQGDIPADVYLKGFVGAAYNGHGFEELDKKAYSGQNLQLFQWLAEESGNNGFSPVTELSYAIENSIGNINGARSQIQINNVGAYGKYIYVPYSASSVFVGDEQKVNIFNKDLNIKNSIFGSNTTYNIDMWKIGSGDGILIASQLDEKWQDADYLVNNHSYFAQREQNYADFVRDNYLDIPEELMEYFSGQSLRRENGVYNVTWFVRAFLADRLSYNENPISTYRGAASGDYIVNLLDKDRQGYGVHYAAAAVMLYRYFGIPARYVEGFVTNGGSRVRRSDLHAWPEIYMDGIGWIPAEVTPGMYQEDVDDNILILPLAGTEDSEDIESETNQGDDGEGDGSRSHFNGLTVVFIILAIVFIAAIIMVRRELLLKARTKKIRGRDATAGIAFMAGLIIKWAKYKNVEIRDDFPDDVSLDMDREFPVFAEGGYDIVVNAIEHSLYSKQGANEDDRKTLEIYLMSMAKQIYESAGLMKRAKYKYLDVLV